MHFFSYFFFKLQLPDLHFDIYYKLAHDDSVELKITNGSFKWERSLTSAERQAIHAKALKNSRKGKSATLEKLHNVAEVDVAHIFSLREISLTVKKVGDIDVLVLVADGYLNDVVLGGVCRNHGTCGVRQVHPSISDIGGAYQRMGRCGNSGSR